MKRKELRRRVELEHALALQKLGVALQAPSGALREVRVLRWSTRAWTLAEVLDAMEDN